MSNPNSSRVGTPNKSSWSSVKGVKKSSIVELVTDFSGSGGGPMQAITAKN